MLRRQNELLCDILQQTASNFFSLTSFGSWLKVLDNKMYLYLKNNEKEIE